MQTNHNYFLSVHDLVVVLILSILRRNDFEENCNDHICMYT